MREKKSDILYVLIKPRKTHKHTQIEKGEAVFAVIIFIPSDVICILFLKLPKKVFRRLTYACIVVMPELPEGRHDVFVRVQVILTFRPV